jgi:hypothetical protein
VGTPVWGQGCACRTGGAPARQDAFPLTTLLGLCAASLIALRRRRR